jgi:hypothetical protein
VLARHLRILRSLSSVLAVTAFAGCASESGGVVADDDALTSVTARQRALTFEGIVYVDGSASDATIVEIARQQTRSAFGALRHAEVATQAREFQNVDPTTFRKRTVRVVDASIPNDVGRDMVEVRYTYKDNAIVPVAMARKTALSLALFGQGSEPKTDDIVEQCTKNDKEAREEADLDLLWYAFDPQRASCVQAMEREQERIDKETAALSDPGTMVPASRVYRMLVPVTMQLARADTATRATYPEYDRLFAGPSEPGVLKLALLTGRLALERVEAKKDGGYYEWLAMLDVIFTDNPDFELKKIEPSEEISSITVGDRRYDNLGFKDFIQWTVYGRGWPKGMPTSNRDDIASAVANKLDEHWITFEKKVKVSIAGAEPKDLVIRLETQFGVDRNLEPHRRALKSADVFVYNGHTYLGGGPLDPENYDADSFTPSYQLLWFDSCLSYNYYNKEFFGLKRDGSKDLDLIVNGLEAPELLGGESEGYFINKLIGGTMPSYQTLLATAKPTDSLRVVEGEIDNRFDPRLTPIRILR